MASNLGKYRARASAERKGVSVQPFISAPVIDATSDIIAKTTGQPVDRGITNIPELQQQAPPIQQPISDQVPPQLPPVQPVSKLEEYKERAKQERLEPVAEVKEPETTVFEDIKDFFTGGLRETEETKELPEVLDPGGLNVGNLGSNLKIAAGLLISMDEEDQIDVIKSAAPETNFRKDKKGNWIGDYKGQKFVLNKPGASLADVQRTIVQMAIFYPAAKFAQLGKAIWSRAALGGIAAAETETAVQQATTELGGKQGISPGRIALAGGLGAAAETIVPAVQGIRQARRAKALGVAAEELESVRGSTDEITEALGGLSEAGVKPPRVFQAQQTQSTARLEEQSLAASLPAGARKARYELLEQNKEVAQATDDLINMIATEESLEFGEQAFQTASKKAVENAELALSEATSPLYIPAYREADKAKLMVDTKPLLNKIDDILDNYGSGPIQNLLKDVRGGLVSASKPNKSGSNLKRLHNEKRQLYAKVDSYRTKNGPLDKETAKIIDKVRGDLRDSLVSSSELYGAANTEYARLVPEVSKLEKSIIGRAAKAKPEQLAGLAERTFGPKSNKRSITQAKKIIESVDPQAWDDLVRAELERRMGTLRRSLPESAEGASAIMDNLPAQIQNKIFGNKKQREVLFAALSDEQAKNFRYLDTVLGRARLGRPGGSQTGIREEIKKRLRGAVTSIKLFFKPSVSTLTGVGEAARFDRNTKVLAEALFAPNWKPRLKELRALSPDSPAAARAMTQLLNDVDKTIKKEEQ